jgi:hypothetical protein
VISSQDQQQRAGEEVRQPPRADLAGLDGEPLGLQAQAGQERRADPAVEIRQDVIEAVLRLHQLARAAAALRQSAWSPEH